jgi:DNA polymerase-3 subunit epsilon
MTIKEGYPMIGLFFDTETTGVKSYRNPGFVPRLVQLGAILQDLETRRVLAELNLIIAPEGNEIPEGASKVHGITTEMAERFGVGMEGVDQIFAEIVTMADIIVAHNIAFDLDILKDNLPTSSLLAGSKQPFCTMEASRYIIKAPLTPRQLATPHLQEHPFKSPGLMETHQHFLGRPFDGAHDAMADIRACRDVFLQLIERGHFELSEQGMVAK